jgi:predicted MFS family arabinose efflux permease
MTVVRRSQSSQTGTRLVLTPLLARFLAVATAISVANLYYVQPLLRPISQSLGIAPSTAGLLVTFSQLGYALGLFVFVPLGDGTDRRKTIVALLGAVTIFLLLVALASPWWLLAVGAFLVGMTTVVPQIIVPLAADLAEPGRSGRAVGMVMSGLLLGILASRVFSGYLAEWLGWRAVFAAGAVLSSALIAGFLWLFPPLPPRARMSYRALMGSIWQLVQSTPALREASLSGAALFAIFSALWTTLALHLSAPPFDYGPGVVGLFGLAGLAGAAMASLAGRLADRRPPEQQVAQAYLLAAIGVAILAIGGDQLIPLVIGVLVVDGGCMFGHVSNQSRVYQQNPEAKSRLNTVYMVVYFLGGSLGSWWALLAYQHWNWLGVTLLQLGLAGLGYWLPPRIGGRSSSERRPAAQ